MLTAFWSAKGGVGTTTTAALVAANVAKQGVRTIVVDLAGDMPAVLGVSNSQHGLSDLVRLDSAATAEQIARVTQEVGTNLAVLARGAAPLEADEQVALEPRLVGVLRVLRQRYEAVLVDCGCRCAAGEPDGASGGWPALAALESAKTRVLVTRLCYLSAARSRAALVGRDDGYTTLVVVREGGRALRLRDLEHALGLTASDVIELEPSISRLVDCGSLASRAPRVAVMTVRNCAGTGAGSRRWSSRINELVRR